MSNVKCTDLCTYPWTKKYIPVYLIKTKFYKSKQLAKEECSRVMENSNYREFVLKGVRVIRGSTNLT